MFNEVEYWLFWNMLQDVLNLAGPIRPATLWGQPWFLLSACAATQEPTVCWGNDGQCNISLQFIPVWLWKCKLLEVSKHGKGSKMWGPGSVSKSFLAAWHLRCNEVPWSIRTLALCEITPLYQSWSIKVSKRYFSQKSSSLLTAQSCGRFQSWAPGWLPVANKGQTAPQKLPHAGKAFRMPSAPGSRWYPLIIDAKRGLKFPTAMCGCWEHKTLWAPTNWLNRPCNWSNEICVLTHLAYLGLLKHITS